MIIEYINYWVSLVLMLLGLYGVMANSNLIRKMIGLTVFQVSVLLFYISFGNVIGGMPPILTGDAKIYVNPVPHVLMLTAIVVGVSVLAVGLALIIRIHEAYGSIEEDEIIAMDIEANHKEREDDAVS